MEKLIFKDERHNAEISYIIDNGYYLEDETINNDEKVEHTEFTHSLFLKGLQTKTHIKEEEILELVGIDREKNAYYAQWYNQLEDSTEYINFI